jgi:hypothetical protein
MLLPVNAGCLEFGVVCGMARIPTCCHVLHACAAAIPQMSRINCLNSSTSSKLR